VSWPINAGGRAAPATTGVSAAALVFRMTFGLSKPYTSTPTVSPLTVAKPGVAQLLFDFFRSERPGETCTTVVAALSAESAMHVDGGNVGTTWTGCGGAHRGGRLWVSDGSAKGTAHSTRNVLFGVSAQDLHCTLRFEGRRLVLTYYTHRSYNLCTPDVQRRLKAFGAPLPHKAVFKQLVAAQSTLPPKPQRLAVARTAWRRFAGAGHAQAPAMPGRKRGQRRCGAYVCWSSRKLGFGKTTARKWCSEKCRRKLRA